MSRYKLADHPNGDFAVLDKDTDQVVKTLRTFNEAMRLLAMLNAEGPREPDRTHLSTLLQEAVAAFNAMTPEEQEAHLKAQRESWVRGEMALGEWERGMTRTIAPRPVPCCDCREKLNRTERACDLYRVALAQIQRTTSDTETAEYAIDKLTEAAAMLNRDSTI